MSEDIYIQAEKLKELIENDERVKKLRILDEKMSQNEEVMTLAYKKDMAVVAYSDVLKHFSKDSEEAKESFKKVHEAKLELDNHPLVKEYLSIYSDVRDMYGEINEIVFSNFSLNLCPKE